MVRELICFKRPIERIFCGRIRIKVVIETTSHRKLLAGLKACIRIPFLTVAQINRRPEGGIQLDTFIVAEDRAVGNAGSVIPEIVFSSILDAVTINIIRSAGKTVQPRGQARIDEILFIRCLIERLVNQHTCHGAGIHKAICTAILSPLVSIHVSGHRRIGFSLCSERIECSGFRGFKHPCAVVIHAPLVVGIAESFIISHRLIDIDHHIVCTILRGRGAIVERYDTGLDGIARFIKHIRPSIHHRCRIVRNLVGGRECNFDVFHRRSRRR